MTQLSATLLLLAVGILGTIVWRSRQMQQQAIRLQEAAQAIIRGDASARVELTHGPLAGAGVAFNEMVAQVEQRAIRG
jgi:methyl-accepting chemotaxis protein